MRTWDLSVAILLCVTFVMLRLCLTRRIEAGSRRILVVIISASVLGNGLYVLVPDVWLGDRLLHVWAGGFAGSVACLLAFGGDSQSEVRPVILDTSAGVFALGLLNEVWQIAFAYWMSNEFTPDWIDIAWDIFSNTTGIGIGVWSYVHFEKLFSRG